MKLDNLGSEQIYVGDEGTVSRFRWRIVRQQPNGHPIGGYWTMDILINNVDPELRMVAVREGATTDGILTDGCAGMWLDEIRLDGSPAPLGVIPDAFRWRINPRSIITYLAPCWHVFAQQLGVLG